MCKHHNTDKVAAIFASGSIPAVFVCEGTRIVLPTLRRKGDMKKLRELKSNYPATSIWPKKKRKRKTKKRRKAKLDGIEEAIRTKAKKLARRA